MCRITIVGIMAGALMACAAAADELAPAKPVADGRLDAEGFPEWPRFDGRAAADTLAAINRLIPVERSKTAKKPKRPLKKPGEQPAQERPRLETFEFEPEFTHGEFANLPNGAYIGAVVAPNRKIYFIPFNAATVLVYDTDKGTTESIGLPNGHVPEKYVGGVLGANGCIYCTPFHHAAEFAVIDTKTHEVKMLFARSGGWKWRGGVAAAGGKIYCPPDQAGVVFTVDTAHGDVTGEFANNPPFPGSGFSGATIGGDGRIYFAPLDSRTCFRVDPWRQDKVEIFGNAPGGFAYHSAVTGPDGRVYCVPANADHVLVIDPARRSAVPLQFPGNEPVGGRWKCVGGVMGPDGNIYCIPSVESRILVVDTPKEGRTEAALRYWGRDVKGKLVEYRQEKYVEGAYHGGVLGPDGRIYFVPFNAKHLLAIGKKQRMNMNWVLSPMFNKL
jgi:streptogramin lyase